MTQNILVLIDFSEVTEELIERSMELGGLYGAKCWLLHIAQPDPDFVGYDVGPQYIRDSRAETLRGEHSKLQAYKAGFSDRGVQCEALLVQGPLFETIDSEIKKLRADLVVAGSHGRSMLYEILVGSVCEHLLRHADVPLLVIPSPQKRK